MEPKWPNNKEEQQATRSNRGTHNPKVAGSNPAPATNLPVSNLLISHLPTPPISSIPRLADLLTNEEKANVNGERLRPHLENRTSLPYAMRVEAQESRSLNTVAERI